MTDRSGVPTFSVILTTFERPGFLEEAVQSVLEQTYPDFELIVVDDGSLPPAQVPDDPRIELVRQETNRGIAAARNRGLAVAKGDYICFLDDDDWYDPERLAMVVPVITQTPILLCFSAYRGHPPSGRLLNGLVAGQILAHTAPAIGSTTVRRVDAVPFNEHYAASEDLEWWIRMSSHPVATVPEVGYWVRKHDGVREAHGASARIAGSLRLLQEHEDYFNDHPAAAAFRWKRIGLLYSSLGDRRNAALAFARSFRMRPEVRTVWHLFRSVARPARS